ncbi:PASTA domain-containing protein [Kitasatospora sp. NPDC051170]|uniref:PASTA domain-containing protein n=1 Tax=Kitasatospora sp. NPDC051170 TaxID=3364056 RepID=UPI00378D3E00
MLLATPEPSPSPGTGGTPAGPSVLSWGETLTALVIIAAVILVIGLILWLTTPVKNAPGSGVARSWIALSLISGLLFSGVLAFAVNDSTIRSGLVGALGAAVGAATAFFFSSKSTDQAHDLLTSSMGTETIPDLLGRTSEDAMRVLSTTTLKLVSADPSYAVPAPGRTVAKQDPAPGTTAPKGTTVQVTYA